MVWWRSVKEIVWGRKFPSDGKILVWQDTPGNKCYRQNVPLSICTSDLSEREDLGLLTELFRDSDEVKGKGERRYSRLGDQHIVLRLVSVYIFLSLAYSFTERRYHV